MKYCIINTTCPNKKEAKKLAELLLDKKLAACVQISKIQSFYSWKGKCNKDNEYLLCLKTKQKNYKKIEELILKIHSYEIPEVIMIEINDGSKKYLEWIDQNCT